MGLRYEVWTLPWDPGGFKRKIAKLPVIEGTGRGSLSFSSVAGEGSCDVDLATFDRIGEVVSDTVGSLIRVFDGITIIHEWLARRVSENFSDENRIVSISGPSLQGAFDDWINYPYDYPKDPSLFPDWEWGSDGKTNRLRNNEFDATGETEKQQYHVHGSSGTYTITVPSFGTTTGLAPYENGGRASDVKAALEAIAGISTVSVTGRGHTQYDPLVIEFLDPLQNFDQITIDDSSLVNSGCAHPPCHSPVISTIRNGSFSIEPWTRCQDPLKGSLNPILHGTYDSISVVDDPVLGAPTKAIRVDPGQSNAGIQQIVSAKEGSPVFGSFDAYSPSTTDEFFISILDKSEKIIDRQGPFTLALANTWETFQLDTVSLDGELLDNEIVYRVQVSAGHTEPSVFHLKNLQLFEGQAAATPGEIVNALMDDITSDHAADPRGTALTWVDYSTVTATLDSSGASWLSEISFNVPFGSSLGQAWDGLADLGYEWDLVPKSSPSGGLTHDLLWYEKGNRDDNPSTAITIRQGVTGGSVVRRIPSFTSVVMEGKDGAFLEDTDATNLANFGRLERFIAARRTPDDTTLGLLADEAFSQEGINQRAVRFEVVESLNHPRPMIDYRPGDSVPMQMPPALPKETRRVQSIDYVNTFPTQYIVVGSRVLSNDAGGWELVRRMWREFQRRDQDTVGGGGGSGTASYFIDVAAVNAPQWQKDAARYVCDGYDDHIEIAAAMDDIANEARDTPQTPGQKWPRPTLQLSSGLFHIDPGVVAAMAGSHLRGMGQLSTMIRNQGTGFGDDWTQSLIVVAQDGELSDLSFWTTSDFTGICVTTNYGIVHDLHHYGGQAWNFVYFRGTIHTCHSLDSWGNYDWANPEPSGGGTIPHAAMLAFSEGWYEVHGVNFSGRGTAIWVDSFGNATLTNVRAENGLNNVEPNFPSPLVILADLGGLALSNVALRAVFAPAIESQGYGGDVLISNAWLQGTYGLKNDPSWGLGQLHMSNVVINAYVSGIDIEDVEDLDIVGLTVRKASVGGGDDPGGPGYGVRVEIALSSRTFSLSNFHIHDGFEEDGINVFPQNPAIPPGSLVSISDGIVEGSDKHGVVIESMKANIHDVAVKNVGLGAANTYDAIHLKGSMDRPRVVDCTIIGAAQLRYGINVSENSIVNAIIVGNDGPDASDFGTDALNNQGTGTFLEYPSDATYGDNFFASETRFTEELAIESDFYIADETLETS